MVCGLVGNVGNVGAVSDRDQWSRQPHRGRRPLLQQTNKLGIVLANRKCKPHTTTHSLGFMGMACGLVGNVGNVGAVSDRDQWSRQPHCGRRPLLQGVCVGAVSDREKSPIEVGDLSYKNSGNGFAHRGRRPLLQLRDKPFH
jgi:hypothetical protein